MPPKSGETCLLYAEVRIELRWHFAMRFMPWACATENMQAIFPGNRISYFLLLVLPFLLMAITGTRGNSLKGRSALCSGGSLVCQLPRVATGGKSFDRE